MATESDHLERTDVAFLDNPEKGKKALLPL